MTWTRRQAGALAFAPLLAMCGKRVRDPSGEMARDQLIFAAWQPEPLVALLVLQRQRAGDDQPIYLEAKAFVAARAELKLLFFDRVVLDEWPQDLAAAVAAWQRSGARHTARPSLAQLGSTLQLGVQLPSGGLQLQSDDLSPAGEVSDPHGRAALQAGTAQLTLNGQTWRGQLLCERLQPGARAWVHYRRFAMWAMVTGTGALVLARVHGDQADPAAVLVQSGRAARITLPANVVRQALDTTTGLPIVQQWQVLDPPQPATRTAGTTVRGQNPSGGAALYDMAVVRGDGLLALVSTLAD